MLCRWTIATIVVVDCHSFNWKTLENLVLFSLYRSCRCETRCGILKGSWQSWHTPPLLAVCSKVLPLTACGSIYDVYCSTGGTKYNNIIIIGIAACCGLGSYSPGRSFLILVCSRRLGICMFRIDDLCHFFYTPGPDRGKGYASAYCTIMISPKIAISGFLIKLMFCSIILLEHNPAMSSLRHNSLDSH